MRGTLALNGLNEKLILPLYLEKNGKEGLITRSIQLKQTKFVQLQHLKIFVTFG